MSAEGLPSPEAVGEVLTPNAYTYLNRVFGDDTDINLVTQVHAERIYHATITTLHGDYAPGRAYGEKLYGTTFLYVKGMSPEYIAQRYNFSPDAAVTVIGRYVQNLAGRVKASFKEARGREPTLRDYWRVTDEQRLQRIEEMERAIRDTGDREMFDHLAAARYPELVAFARSYAAQNALAARLNSKEAAYRAIEKVLEVITHHEQSGIPRPPVSLDYFLSAVQAVYASKRIYRRRSDYGA